MKNLIILGTGDFGREMAHMVERINDRSAEKKWNLLGFSTNDEEIKGSVVDGYDVICTDDELKRCTDEIYVICSLGVSKARKRVVEKISNPNIKFATLIDPDVKLFRDAEVGEGSVICAGSIFAINTHVGKHVIVNLNSTLGHDVVVEDYCVINPGVNISGKVTVHECSDLGTGSKVIQGLSIGPNTTVGAGAAVVRDIPPNCVAVGVPAKPIKFFSGV